MKRTPSLIFPLVLLSALLLSVLLPGCADRSPRNPLLREASRLLDESPDSAAKALSILDSISTENLSEFDRNYHTLLTVKAHDKLYMSHTGDSAINAVAEFFNGRGYGRYHTESLYYAGRVYADNGDFPTALDYFQKALDSFDSSENDNRLLGAILSQTGGLYSDLELHSEAVVYLREVLRINEMRKDTVNLCLDNLLIGNSLMHKGVTDSATLHFGKAYDLSTTLPAPYREYSALHKAVLFSESERHDSAMYYVQGLPRELWEDIRPWAMISIADIYYKAERPDSAYKYALLVVENPDPAYDIYRRRGYSILLSSSLEGFIDRDSVYPMARRWLVSIKREFDSRDAGSVARQKSEYNYSLHQRKGEEAEIRSLKLVNLVTVLIIVLMLVIVSALIVRNNKKKETIRLLETIGTLRNMLGKSSGEIVEKPATDKWEEDKVCHHTSSKEEDTSVEEYRQLIKELSGKSRDTITDGDVLDPEFIGELQAAITSKTSIPPESPFWERLESAVLKVSPHFTEILYIIITGLTVRELRVCMLMKYRVRPSQIAAILVLSKQGMSSLRTRLRKKIKLANLNSDEFDRMIENL